MAAEQDLGTLAIQFEAQHKEFLGAVAKLDAGVAQFEKTTAKQTGLVAKSFKQMGAGIKKQLLGLGAGFAAYASARGIVAATTANLDFLDSIDKTSQKLGVSTDFLQKADYAASQSGIRFETLTMSMQRFTRRAGEAANGTGEAKDAIRQLGIELRDSQGRMRSSEALFSDAMAALARVDEPAEKLRLAFKLFDSEGAVLVNLANDFETLSAKAQSLGLVVDKHLIDTAVKAKDDLDTLSRVTKAKLAPALVELTPALKAVAEQFVLIADYAAKAWNWFHDFANLDPVGIKDTRDRIGELKREISEMEGRLVRMGEGRGYANARKVTRRAIAEARVDLEMLEARLKSLLERSRAEGEGAAPGAAAPAAPPVAPAERQKLMRTAEKWFEDLPTGDELMARSRRRIGAATGLPQPEVEGVGAWGQRIREEAGILPETEMSESQARFKEMTSQMGADVRDDVKYGLIEGIQTGKIDATAILGDVGESISTRFLETGLDDMMDGMQEGLEGVFDWAGPKLGEVFGGMDLGPLQEKLGGAFSAAAGIGMAMLMRQIGGTRSRQTYADIQRASGVTETQEVRGVISGPKEIAVAKIGGHIGEAMTEVMARPTELLERIAELTAAQLTELRGMGGGGGGLVDSEATMMLQSSVGLS